MRLGKPRFAFANRFDLLRGSDCAFKALRLRYGIKQNCTNAFAAYLYRLGLYASFHMTRAHYRSGANNSLFGQRDLLY